MTITIQQQLKERLEREVPAFTWVCKLVPGHDRRGTSGIEISATSHGQPVTPHPMHLSATMVERWGMDSSARLICKEFSPRAARLDGDWDKLSEL